MPWKAHECAKAGTVHLGGTLEEVAEPERAPWDGRCADKPYVLVVQPSAVRPDPRPAGKHTLWGYCHVPNGSTWT